MRQYGRLVVVTLVALAPVFAAAEVTLSEAKAPTLEREQALRPTDERLEVLIESALAADSIVESFEIVVTVVDGAVRLNGAVDTDDERARAGSIAADVEGVTEVENRLTVEKTLIATDRSDEEIRRIALDEASEALPEEDIDIRVENAFATLTGSVSSVEARREMTEIAFKAGATLVKNQLRIERD